MRCKTIGDSAPLFRKRAVRARHRYTPPLQADVYDIAVFCRQRGFVRAVIRLVGPGGLADRRLTSPRDT